MAFDTKIDGKRLIVKLYEILNSSENKALYKTAMGENINSTNQEIMVGIQDNARAKLSRAIKNEVSDYKIKARTEWLGKPENQELFGDFTGKLEEINNGTIESTIKNLSNF